MPKKWNDGTRCAHLSKYERSLPLKKLKERQSKTWKRSSKTALGNIKAGDVVRHCLGCFLPWKVCDVQKVTKHYLVLKESSVDAMPYYFLGKHYTFHQYLGKDDNGKMYRVKRTDKKGEPIGDRSWQTYDKNHEIVLDVGW